MNKERENLLFKYLAFSLWTMDGTEEGKIVGEARFRLKLEYSDWFDQNF